MSIIIIIIISFIRLQKVYSFVDLISEGLILCYERERLGFFFLLINRYTTERPYLSTQIFALRISRAKAEQSSA